MRQTEAVRIRNSATTPFPPFRKTKAGATVIFLSSPSRMIL